MSKIKRGDIVRYILQPAGCEPWIYRVERIITGIKYPMAECWLTEYHGCATYYWVDHLEIVE